MLLVATRIGLMLFARLQGLQDAWRGYKERCPQRLC